MTGHLPLCEEAGGRRHPDRRDGDAERPPEPKSEDGEGKKREKKERGKKKGDTTSETVDLTAR